MTLGGQSVLQGHWRCLSQTLFLQLSDSAGEEDPADLKSAQKGEFREVPRACGEVGRGPLASSTVFRRLMEAFLAPGSQATMV